MRQKPTVAERLSSTEVALVPTDTLLRALRVMEQSGTWLLPVLGEAGGLVGLVSRAHLLSGWKVDPLLPVALVMVACEKPPGPGRESSAPW